MANQNICCRIFKEQFDLVKQLPEPERYYVLYLALNNAFNQNENQNDNQNENQIECAYISVSESVYISQLGKCILNILYKNLVSKKFSSNYGGSRIGAGRKSLPETQKETPKPERSRNNTPTLEDVLDFAKQMHEARNVGGFFCTKLMAEEFWSNYEANGWIIGNEYGTPIRDWKAKLRQWCLKEMRKPDKDGIPNCPVQPKGDK